LSESIINPYRFAGVPCESTCWEVNNGGDHGMDTQDQACCQRIDTGSQVIGLTISNISMWLKSGSGSGGTCYGVLFDTDYDTVITTFGSINIGTVGTSFTKFTFDNASTTGTITGAGQYLGIWYDNPSGGTLDVRANTSGDVIADPQTCTTGSRGSPTSNSSNSFTWCYECA